MSDFRNEILSRINASAGGNSKRDLKKLASDLVNSSGLKNRELADITFLSVTTIERMRTLKETETGNEYCPQARTIERIFNCMGAEVSLTPVKIQKRYQNKPKGEA